MKFAVVSHSSDERPALIDAGLHRKATDSAASDRTSLLYTSRLMLHAYRSTALHTAIVEVPDKLHARYLPRYRRLRGTRVQRGRHVRAVPWDGRFI